MTKLEDVQRGLPAGKHRKQVSQSGGQRRRTAPGRWLGWSWWGRVRTAPVPPATGNAASLWLRVENFSSVWVPPSCQVTGGFSGFSEAERCWASSAVARPGLPFLGTCRCRNSCTCRIRTVGQDGCARIQSWDAPAQENKQEKKKTQLSLVSFLLRDFPWFFFFPVL